jgi:hypothetical protein
LFFRLPVHEQGGSNENDAWRYLDAGYHSCVDESNPRGRYGKLSGVGQSVVRCTVSVAALALLASGAAAETLSNSNSPDNQPSAGAASAKLPQITVEAQRKDTERRVHEFVSRVAVLSHYESLARWTTPICPLVAGLPRNDGEFVLTRFSEIAASIGAPLAPRHCDVNFVVLVASDPVASLNAWVARTRYRNLFGDAGPTQIKRFFNTQRAVRVWYNDTASGANGSVLTPGSSLPGAPCPGLSSSVGAPVNCFAGDTRVERTVVWTISSVIEVVDADAMKGFKFEQMADYIAMAGLAEFNLDADFGSAPTILRVFLAPSENGPPSLTDWDKCYLRALYHVRLSSTMQTALINQSIVRDINH